MDFKFHIARRIAWAAISYQWFSERELWAIANACDIISLSRREMWGEILPQAKEIVREYTREHFIGLRKEGRPDMANDTAKEGRYSLRFAEKIANEVFSILEA